MPSRAGKRRKTASFACPNDEESSFAGGLSRQIKSSSAEDYWIGLGKGGTTAAPLGTPAAAAS
jgi:hypothetical protein